MRTKQATWASGSGPRGFTLIELLIVIAVIAVVMALIVPAVMRVRSVGDRAKVRSEIAGIQMAASNFNGTVSSAGYPLVSVTPSVTRGPRSRVSRWRPRTSTERCRARATPSCR